MTDLAALRRHIYELAAAFDCEVHETTEANPEDAFAIPGRRAIVIAPIREEAGYVIALHELGHLNAPLGFLGAERRAAESAASRHNFTLTEEQAAWEWAEHHALYWSAAMTQVRDYALGSYRDFVPPTPAPPPAPIATVHRDVATFAKQIRWGPR